MCLYDRDISIKHQLFLRNLKPQVIKKILQLNYNTLLLLKLDLIKYNNT